MLTVDRINWEYRKRIEAGPRRKYHKSKTELLLAGRTRDLWRLLAARGGNDRIIQVYLENPSLILNGTSASIGEEIALSLAERRQLRIWSFRPYDVAWRKVQRLSKLERNSRKKLRERERRLAAGMVPWSESAARREPWNEFGIKRTKWFDLKKEGTLDAFISSFYEKQKGAQAVTEVWPTPTQGDRSPHDGGHRGSARPLSNGSLSTTAPNAAPKNGRCDDHQSNGADESVPPPIVDRGAAQISPTNSDGGVGGRHAERQADDDLHSAGREKPQRSEDLRSVRARQVGAKVQIGPQSPKSATAGVTPSPPEEEGQPMAPELRATEPKPSETRGETVKELHPYQQEAIDNLRHTLRSGINRIVLQAPTGAGKTTIAAEITNLARAKGNKVAFVVPAISLIDQTVEAFYADGLRDVGVIQANHQMTDWSRPIQVCSIQTIQARKTRPECQIIVFDECHRLYKAHKDWLTDPEWSTRPMIGLSATPWTKGLGKYYQTLLKVTTTAELIDMGYLCPFDVYATGHPNLDGVKIQAGDYHEGQLAERMNQPELTADIIKTYRKLWNKGRTLVFAVDCAHAQSIQARFEHEGISCGYQDANTSPAERAEIKRKFHSGEYQVVANVETLTTGVDWKVGCLILARPTKSEMLFVQIIGRALRTDKDNPTKRALILDHSDTTSRMGFVTDIDHDELDDGQPKNNVAAEKKEALPKPCSQCSYLKPPKTPKCPNCGHEAKVKCMIHENDGELHEISLGRLPKKKSDRPHWTEIEKQSWFLSLKKDAMDFWSTRQHLPRHWVHEKLIIGRYRTKFGTYPQERWNLLPLPASIPPDVKSWIRSQKIRRAKGQTKHIKNQRAAYAAEASHG